jgi:Tfp pilus assembly protein PilF
MATIQEALANGWTLLQEGKLAQAEQIYRGLIQTNPSVVQAWHLLGAIAQLKGKPGESLGFYQEALRLAPSHVEARNNLGVALHALGRADLAEECIREAIRVKPDFADAHSNLGNILQDRGMLDDAIACYRHAIQLKRDYLDAYNNLGNALRAQQRSTEALECYDEALRINPNHAQVHLSRALIRLQLGDFERGWAEYEWRLKCQAYAIPSFPRPMWDGSPLGGQTILIYGDHGLGDTLQFIRYAPLVAERGGRVIVAVRKPLARVLASCPDVEAVIPEGAPLPDFAVYIPAMSLPRIFATTLATIPVQVPYLSADAALIKQWSEEIGQDGGLRIGIAWQGNPTYSKDRQRSIALTQFEPLSRLERVRLFSLQKGHGVDQIGCVASRFAVTDLGSRFTDFLDTAAAMKNLDLVMAADTSIVHLAGAFGLPVWAALPFDADWRWLLDRDDSPWYPTLRLFRQTRPGDWDEVFQRITNAVARRPERGAGTGLSTG